MNQTIKNSILILSPLIFILIFLLKIWFHWSELPSLMITHFDTIGISTNPQPIQNFIITSIMFQAILGLFTSLGVWFTIYKTEIFPLKTTLSLGNFIIGLITGILIFLIEKNAQVDDTNLIWTAILGFGGVFYSFILCDKFEEKREKPIGF